MALTGQGETLSDQDREEPSPENKAPRLRLNRVFNAQWLKAAKSHVIRFCSFYFLFGEGIARVGCSLELLMTLGKGTASRTQRHGLSVIAVMRNGLASYTVEHKAVVTLEAVNFRSCQFHRGPTTLKCP